MAADVAYAHCRPKRWEQKEGVIPPERTTASLDTERSRRLTSLIADRAEKHGPDSGNSRERRVRFLAEKLRGYIAGLPKAFAVEFDRGQSLVWVTLCYAFGIFLYFELPAEPSPYAVAALAFFFCSVQIISYSRPRYSRILGLVLASVLGLCVALLRTTAVEAPILEHSGSVNLTGFVESMEDRPSSTRMQIRVIDISGLDRKAWPEKVRISVRGNAPEFSTGDAVTLRSRLLPLPGPVVPGGYDYAFRMYYEGVGATGFAFGAPEVNPSFDMPWDLRLKRWVDTIRQGFAERIKSVLGYGRAGALAVALLVGDRSSIDENTEDTLRTAGLAHILAISGLHMALFAGSVFFAVRAVLALFPSITLRFSIDTWGAGAALFAAAFYLVLSGASIATQRAFVMIALVLVGRLLGRNAITFRSVALAALLILTLSPEALLAPGFQMSFSAVIVLIAAYEEVTRRSKGRLRENVRVNNGIFASVFKTLFYSIAALALTSLVAGAATGVIGAYHFHRAAPLGLLVNVAAMPIASLIIMPFGVLSLALMPFGLDALTLPVMGYGLKALYAVAEIGAENTPHQGIVGAQSYTGVMFVVAAGLMLCLFPRKYRRLSAIPFLFAAIAITTFQPADIYISERGNKIAYRNSAGILRILGSRNSFEAETWLRMEGIAPEEQRSHRVRRSFHACDDDACIIRAYPANREQASAASKNLPLVLSLVEGARAFAEDCERSDIIITRIIAPADCQSVLVLDKDALKRQGARAIWLDRSSADSAAIKHIDVARKYRRRWAPSSQ
ncbi:ComEC family competence protein [Rhizobiales bacterium]|uniref:ComEC/Rec2 family competence protein n=1 Tax=Hongsoonwoonella zoysiae TaxID=2821844 RepID=UPI0015602BBB|nr:ComEC/Rec2 family competence protein [Hongsoonwoonella zoysiae]NRG18710.1 ComEC family competence protein [Hongsoonwoonella zoysiae]